MATSGPGSPQREFLLKYVNDVEPTVLESFGESAPPFVVEAMTKTVTNMMGTLPPDYFDIKISAAGDNLMQLMYSLMMTGYMFRNAQYKLELQSTLLGSGSLDAALDGADGAHTPSSMKAIPPPPSSHALDPDAHAPGVQKQGIAGHITRWNYDEGAVRMSAEEYIDALEAEVESLRRAVAASAQRAQFDDAGNNRLLRYLKGLDPAGMQELTHGVSEDVSEAMNQFLQRLLGTDDVGVLGRTNSSFQAPELARLLFWLLVVGYTLRTYEVRFDMQRSLDMPELPAGREDSGGMWDFN